MIAIETCSLLVLGTNLCQLPFVGILKQNLESFLRILYLAIHANMVLASFAIKEKPFSFAVGADLILTTPVLTAGKAVGTGEFITYVASVVSLLASTIFAEFIFAFFADLGATPT